MVFTPTDPSKALEIIRVMSCGKSPSIDEISSHVLEASAYSIADVVAHKNLAVFPEQT